jgi:hypothetical protein
VAPGSTLDRTARERDEIEVGRACGIRAAGGHRTGQAARIDLDQALAALDREADEEALGVDQVGFRREADEPDRMAGERQPRAEQRAVRRAEDQDGVLALHLESLLRIRGIEPDSAAITGVP